MIGGNVIYIGVCQKINFLFCISVSVTCKYLAMTGVKKIVVDDWLQPDNNLLHEQSRRQSYWGSSKTHLLSN